MKELLNNPQMLYGTIALVLLLFLWSRARSKRKAKDSETPKFLKRVRVLVAAGNFEEAGSLQAKNGNIQEAYNLFARGGVHIRASQMASKLKQYSRAADHAEQAGLTEKAADFYAKAFDNREAVRLYKEVGRFDRAAELLENDNMVPPEELADLWERMLASMIPVDFNLSRLQPYELEKIQEVAEKAARAYQQAGDLERAAKIYEKCQKHELAAELRRQMPTSVLDRLVDLTGSDSSSILPQILEPGAPLPPGAVFVNSNGAPAQYNTGQAPVIQASTVHASVVQVADNAMPDVLQAGTMGYGDYGMGNTVSPGGAIPSVIPSSSSSVIPPPPPHYSVGAPLPSEQIRRSASQSPEMAAMGSPRDVAMNSEELSALTSTVSRAVRDAIKESSVDVRRVSGLNAEPHLAVGEGGMPLPSGHVIEREIHYVTDSSSKQSMAQLGGMPADTDRYEIGEKLGEGGMAVVYRAHDRVLERDVAMKFLPEGFTQNITALELFEREAKAAAGLHHPNIVTIFDFGVIAGRPFICMELLEGSSLEELLKQHEGKGMPLLQVLEVAQGVLAALDCVHEGQLIHRDIKPSNVMLDRRGNVKLMDFGVATILDPERSTRIAGTPHYMAPEQLSGRFLDHRTDIFSFGVMLYQLVTGELPFEGFMRLQAPPSPSTLRDIPKLLNRLVMWCLEFEQDKRPQKSSLLLYAVKKLHLHVQQYLSSKQGESDAPAVVTGQLEASVPANRSRSAYAVPHRHGDSGDFESIEISAAGSLPKVDATEGQNESSTVLELFDELDATGVSMEDLDAADALDPLGNFSITEMAADPATIQLPDIPPDDPEAAKTLWSEWDDALVDDMLSGFFEENPEALGAAEFEPLFQGDKNAENTFASRLSDSQGAMAAWGVQGQLETNVPAVSTMSDPQEWQRQGLQSRAEEATAITSNPFLLEQQTSTQPEAYAATLDAAFSKKGE